MKQNSRILFLALVLLVFCVAQSEADVSLPRIFSSNMVLQQGKEIPVWGQATKGERVTVTFNGTTQRAKADKNGQWRVNLPAQSYGGPYVLTVKGKNAIEFENVMVGEVWICSGQSNMQWTVKDSDNAEEEIAAAGHPGIRLFYVPREVAQFPQSDISGG